MAGVLRAFSLGVPFVAGMNVATAGTRASQRMQYAVYAHDLLRPSLNLLAVLALYVLGWRLLGAVAAGVLSFGVALVASVYYLTKLFPEMLNVRLKPTFVTGELLLFSIPLLFVGFLGMLIMWTDTLMLGYFRPSADVGIYRAASQMAILLTMTLAALNAIFAPMIAELYHRESLEALHELFKVGAKWGFYLTLPLFLIMFFCASEILEVVFGVAYIAGVLPLIILASAQLVNVATGSVGNMLIMSGHQRVWFLNTLSVAAANVLLNLILIPRLGIPGAAIATGISIAGLFLLGLIEVRLILRMSPYDRRYLKGIAAGVVAAGIALSIHFMLPESLPLGLSLLVQVMAILGGFTAVLVSLGLDPEDRTIWRVVRARVR